MAASSSSRKPRACEVLPYEHKLGWRGTNTGPISFNNVRIEDDGILGDVLTGGVMHRAGQHRQCPQPRRDFARLRAGHVRQDAGTGQGTPALWQGHV